MCICGRVGELKVQYPQRPERVSDHLEQELQAAVSWLIRLLEFNSSWVLRIELMRSLRTVYSLICCAITPAAVTTIGGLFLFYLFISSPLKAFVLQTREITVIRTFQALLQVSAHDVSDAWHPFLSP